MGELVIDAKHITEFGMYAENEVLVAGFQFLGVPRITSLIIQHQRPSSQLSADAYGPYVELNGVGHYHALSFLNLSETDCILRIRLTLPDAKEDISIALPSLSSHQCKLLRELASLFRKNETERYFRQARRRL